MYSLPGFFQWKGSWQSRSHAASVRLIEANKKGILSSFRLWEKRKLSSCWHSGHNLIGKVTVRYFMNGHLFNGLQYDSRRIYRERTPRFRNDPMIDTEREVQVVGILDNWSFLEGAFSDTMILFIVVGKLFIMVQIWYVPTCMWHQCVGKIMTPHICIGIWRFWSPQSVEKICGVSKTF